jgi:hypothetical protein
LGVLVFLWLDYRELQKVKIEAMAETNKAYILQTYLDQMATFLLTEDLRDRKVRSVAHALTLTMLHESDPDRRNIARLLPVHLYSGISMPAIDL